MSNLSQPSGIITEGILTPEEIKKRGFHFASVSVPLNVPTHPGECRHMEVPFGPPVIHADPEKTQPAEEVFIGKSSTHFPATSADWNSHSRWFFRTDGPSIYLSEDTQPGRYEDDVIMMNASSHHGSAYDIDDDSIDE
jgi:hypothetical protein